MYNKYLKYFNKINQFGGITSKCINVGFKQHLGECAGDSLQMILINSNYTKDEIQNNLSYDNDIDFTIQNAIKNNNPIMLPFYLIKKMSTPDGIEIISNYLKNVSNRFNHYFEKPVIDETNFKLHKYQVPILPIDFEKFIKQEIKDEKLTDPEKIKDLTEYMESLFSDNYDKTSAVQAHQYILKLFDETDKRGMDIIEIICNSILINFFLLSSKIINYRLINFFNNISDIDYNLDEIISSFGIYLITHDHAMSFLSCDGVLYLYDNNFSNSYNRISKLNWHDYFQKYFKLVSEGKNIQPVLLNLKFDIDYSKEEVKVGLEDFEGADLDSEGEEGPEKEVKPIFELGEVGQYALDFILRDDEDKPIPYGGPEYGSKFTLYHGFNYLNVKKIDLIEYMTLFKIGDFNENYISYLLIIDIERNLNDEMIDYYYSKGFLIPSLIEKILKLKKLIIYETYKTKIDEFIIKLCLLAVKRGDLGIVHYIIDNVDITIEFYELYKYCLANNINDILGKLLSKPENELINYENEENYNTPLLTAIINNNLPLVKFLVDNNADLNYMNINNMTPLIAAIYKENIEIVDYLIKKGADLNQVVLLETNHPDSNKNPDIFLPTNEELLPVTAAINTRNFDIFKLLIDNKAPTKYNASNEELSVYAEMEATVIENLEMLQYLHDHSVDFSIDYMDEDRDTPFKIAIDNKNLELCKLLFRLCDNNEEITVAEETNLINYAIKSKFYEFIYFLVAEAHVNINNNEYQPPLKIAVEDNEIDIVKLLLTFNADPELNDDSGYSALSSAIDDDNKPILKLFLLYSVLKHNNSLLYDLIFEHNMNPTESIEGNSIIQISIDHNLSDIKEILIMYAIIKSDVEMFKLLYNSGIKINNIPYGFEISIFDKVTEINNAEIISILSRKKRKVGGDDL